MNRQVEQKRFKKKHHVNTTKKKAAVTIRGRKKADFRTKYCQNLPRLHGDSTHKGPLSLKPWDKMLRCLFSISKRTWHSTVTTHHKTPPSSPQLSSLPFPQRLYPFLPLALLVSGPGSPSSPLLSPPSSPHTAQGRPLWTLRCPCLLLCLLIYNRLLLGHT